MSPFPSLSFGPWIVQGKRRYINLAGGDLLGLSYNKDFKELIHKGLEKGNLFQKRGFQPFAVNENSILSKLASWKGFKFGLLGYNLFTLLVPLLEALKAQAQSIFVDEASDYEIRLFFFHFPKVTYFFSSSLPQLEKIIVEKESPEPIIFIQTLYPFYSQFPPYQDIIALCKRFNGTLIIYESWADGVVGEDGKGFRALFTGEIPEKLVLLGEFSHILPFSPAYLLTNNEAIANTLLDTPNNLGIIKPSEIQIMLLDWFIEHLTKRELGLGKLHDNANYLRFELLHKGLRTLGEFSPYIPILIGTKRNLLEFSTQLEQAGVLTNSVSDPIVPQEKSRILLISSALHTKEDLDFAIEKILEVAKSQNLV